jgi:hypothetical protein
LDWYLAASGSEESAAMSAGVCGGSLPSDAHVESTEEATATGRAGTGVGATRGDGMAGAELLLPMLPLLLLSLLLLLLLLLMLFRTASFKRTTGETATAATVPGVWNCVGTWCTVVMTAGLSHNVSTRWGAVSEEAT